MTNMWAAELRSEEREMLGPLKKVFHQKCKRCRVVGSNNAFLEFKCERKVRNTKLEKKMGWAWGLKFV